MPSVMQTTIRCPSCGQPFNAAVENMIDAAKDRTEGCASSVGS
jgi:hypothetical protein